MSDASSILPAREDIDLRSLIAVLRRQARIIAATAAACAVAAVLFIAVSTPRFTATALVIVDPMAGDILDDKQPAAPGSGTENARVDTEVEILRSDAVALSVIDRLGLATDPDFLPRPGALDQIVKIFGRANAATAAYGSDAALLDTFRDRMQVRRRGLTYLISVAATAEAPDRAAELANTLAATYIEEQLQARVTASLAGRDALAAELAAARERLAGYERRTDQFFLTNLPADRGGDAPLARAVADTQQQIEAELTRRQDARRYRQSEDWTLLAGLFGDDQLATLAERRDALGRSPAADLSLTSELARVDAALAAKAETHLNALSDSIGALDRRAADLRREMRDTVTIADLPPERLADLYGLQQEAGIAREQYQHLLARMSQLDTSASVQVASSRVVSPAIAPATPSFPDQTFVALVTLALAAGLGVSLAFVNEYMIGGVTSESQLADLLHATVTAEVPSVSIANTGRMTPADKIIDTPLSSYSEAVRKLRAGIDQSLRARASGQAGRVVLVTSALPGEGKSTTALALARAYAVAGRKTLLIDCDLRNPSIHRQLGFEPEIGFQDYLRDPSRPDDVRAFYARDPASKLAMILGAQRSLGVTDQLLCTDTFENILAQARDVYDMTIIDSPPVLPVVDPRYIAPHADIAVMVVKWATTAQGELRAAADQIRRALRPDAALLPVLAQSRSSAALTGYGAYQSQSEYYSAAT